MIREHPRCKKTAIIFISGIYLTEADLARGYELGAVDYVQVPVIPEVLRSKVKIFVDLYRKTRQLEAAQSRTRRPGRRAHRGARGVKCPAYPKRAIARTRACGGANGYLGMGLSSKARDILTTGSAGFSASIRKVLRRHPQAFAPWSILRTGTGWSRPGRR